MSLLRSPSKALLRLGACTVALLPLACTSGSPLGSSRLGHQRPPRAAVDTETNPAVTNRLQVLVGRRSFSHTEYDGVAGQGAIGLEYSREGEADPLGFEIGIHGSQRDRIRGGNEMDMSSSELSFGARKTFGSKLVRPYLGFGATLIHTELERNGLISDGGSLGGYVHGGVALEFEAGFTIGFDLRQVLATDIDYGLVDTNADYGQLAFFFGMRF